MSERSSQVDEILHGSTSADIAERLSRLESLVEALRQIVDSQTKHLMALQAQVDHVEAKRQS